jgi:hypothetical protein
MKNQKGEQLKRDFDGAINKELAEDRTHSEISQQFFDGDFSPK